MLVSGEENNFKLHTLPYQFYTLFQQNLNNKKFFLEDDILCTSINNYTYTVDFLVPITSLKWYIRRLILKNNLNIILSKTLNNMNKSILLVESHQKINIFEILIIFYE